MGSTGRTVGTVGGAAIGTALLPGVGTVLGGALGGVVGGLFDSNGDPGAVGQAQYGGGNNPESQFAHQEADRVLKQQNAQATAYDKTGQNMYAGDTAQGAAALGRGQALGSAAQSNAARLGNTAQSMAFGGQQDAAYNQTRSQNLQNQGVMAANVAGANAGQDRGSQLDALGRLKDFYTQGPGPSAAEAQMRQGQDANMAQAIALAHSERGAGANANAMRSAAFQNAASGQQMNQQLGVLRANEAANWRQQQMGAMGLEQNAMSGMRGQDISQQGNLQSYALGAGQQGLGYGQLGAGYQDIGNKAQEAFSGQGLQGQLGFEGMGNQTNLGFNQAGNQAALGYSQLGNNANQFGESMRNNILQSQGDFNLRQQVANLNAQTGQAATADRRDAANQNLLGSVLNTGVGMMNRSGGTSEAPSESNPWSDVRAKKDIAPADMSRVFGNGGPDLRQAQGYSYEYKDPNGPGRAPGQQVGPMAQDLPPSVVKTGPNGMKQVDAGRLTLVNTAAVSDLQRRTDELEAMLKGRQLPQLPAGPQSSVEPTAAQLSGREIYRPTDRNDGDPSGSIHYDRDDNTLEHQTAFEPNWQAGATDQSMRNDMTPGIRYMPRATVQQRAFGR